MTLEEPVGKYMVKAKEGSKSDDADLDEKDDDSGRKTTCKDRMEDNLIDEDLVDKKLKYNLIREGCWGENTTGLVKVDGVPQPYKPLPQRRVGVKRWRGSQLTRPKPGVFTDQDIRK